MKKLLKIFAVMFIVSVALLAVAAYVPNGDVADAVTADCTHEYSEVVLAQQPTCTQKGWLEHYTCTLCGKYFVKVGEDMVEVERLVCKTCHLHGRWMRNALLRTVQKNGTPWRNYRRNGAHVWKLDNRYQSHFGIDR